MLIKLHFSVILITLIKSGKLILITLYYRPGTPPPAHQLMYSPYQQRQPLEQQGYIGRPVLPPSDPHNLQNLPPHPMWQQYDYPPIAQFPPPFNPQYRYETPGGIPSHHYRYETPRGIPSHHYRYETPGGIPSQHYRYETPGDIPFQHYRHETPGDIPPQQYKQGSQNTTSREPSVHVEPSSTNSEQPSSVSNVKSPTNPKQVPTEKKDNQGKKKPVVQPRQTPKKLDGRRVSEAHKPAMQTKDNQKGKTLSAAKH